MENKFSHKDLDAQGKDYSKEKSVNYSSYIYPYRYRIIRERVKGPDVLELGIGSAVITNKLCEEGFNVISVDGSTKVIENAKNKVGNTENISFIHSYFENFSCDRLFNDILMTNILEHVDDPVKVMTYAKKFLKPGGRIHVTVPNAESFHRLIGKHMGMLENETSLNGYDIVVGHQRVYTFFLLSSHIQSAGLKIIDRTGVMFKALSNSQINELIDVYGEKLTDSLFELGKKFYKNAAEVYVCLEIK
jgi:2-polyprenyl-3-methyl-5-hydroxy-6-metoxy-1,4-benzoquinol methylase